MSTNDPMAEPVTESMLEAPYGDRWDIQIEDLGVWSACRKSADGHHVRVLIARTRGELLAKLQTADVVEP
jgi:hypothetical protein